MAVTDSAEVTEIGHVGAVPEHAPPQPTNTIPGAGVSVSVTAAPFANVAEQVDPQLIPAGLLVTVPLPESITVTVSAVVKMPKTDCAALIVTEHELVEPAHTPLQDWNVDPDPAVPLSVTTAPCGNVAEHVGGQLI
jgi:hypothetical protein